MKLKNGLGMFKKKRMVEKRMKHKLEWLLLGLTTLGGLLYHREPICEGWKYAVENLQTSRLSTDNSLSDLSDLIAIEYGEPFLFPHPDGKELRVHANIISLFKYPIKGLDKDSYMQLDIVIRGSTPRDFPINQNSYYFLNPTSREVLEDLIKKKNDHEIGAYSTLVFRVYPSLKKVELSKIIFDGKEIQLDKIDKDEEKPDDYQ